MGDVDVRQQLEQVRQQGEVNDTAAAQRRAAESEQRARRVEEGGKARRAAELAMDAERVASGFRPERVFFEADAEWEARLGDWRKSDLGVAYLDRQRRDRDAELARRWPFVVEASEVPRLLAERVRAGDLTDTPAMVAVREFVGLILALAGDIGVGKTVAAAAWLLGAHLPGGDGNPRADRASKHPLLWVSAAHLARWPRYDQEKMDRLLKADRLVIDDLFTEYADTKGSFVTTLDEVINDRMANGRQTLITTNADGEAFKERYGARIADRIREHRGWIPLAGESLRRGAAQQTAATAPTQRGLALVPDPKGSA